MSTGADYGSCNILFEHLRFFNSRPKYPPATRAHEWRGENRAQYIHSLVRIRITPRYHLFTIVNVKRGHHHEAMICVVVFSLVGTELQIILQHLLALSVSRLSTFSTIRLIRLILVKTKVFSFIFQKYNIQNYTHKMTTFKQVPLTCGGHTRPVVHLDFSDVTKEGYYLISACKGEFND